MPAAPPRLAAARLALAVLVLAAAACGAPTGRARAAASPLTAVDWASASYPSTCFTTGRPTTVRVHRFVATGPDGFLRMQVRPPTFGRLDGTDVAVLTYRCIGANAGPDTALVYAWGHGRPRLLATLLAGDDVYVSRVHIAAGLLTLTGDGYRPGTPQCCPDLSVTYVFRLSGGRLRAAGERSAPLPTATPTRSA